MARLGKADLVEKATTARKATATAKEKADAKRARKSAVSFDNLPDVPDGQTSKVVLNSDHVQGWFRESLVEKYGKDFIVGRWTVHQKKLAKDLLEVYGGDLVRKAVLFFVASWDALVASSRGQFSGAPSINLLYGMRERIFGDVQLGSTPLRRAGRESEHYGPRDKGVGVGW